MHSLLVLSVWLSLKLGSTIDQICGPREYDVHKRIPLRCASAPSRMNACAGPPRDMKVDIALNPRECNTSQPPARSYVNGQTPGGNMRVPSVAVGATAPWTHAGNSLGSQMPKPVKSAVLKNDEDVPMIEAEDPDPPKHAHKDCNETSSKELVNAVQVGCDSKTPPISKEIVTAQASPLKRASNSINGRTDADPPNNSCEQNPPVGTSDTKQEVTPGPKGLQ